jgi:hypothetical protein
LISIALAGLGPKVTRRDEGHSDFHASPLHRRELFRHGRVEQRMKKTVLCLALCAVTCLGGCGRAALVSSDALPLQRVVIYRNGVGYFERHGHVETGDVRFKMRSSEVGDFLATLAVMERGGSSVKAAAFPLEDEEKKPRDQMTEDEKRGLKTVVLSLDGKRHDLQVGYVAESPVWKPSYRLVVRDGGESELQAWGIVQNLSGEDWKNVTLSLVAGAPLAFQAQLGEAVIPLRPTVTDTGEVIAAVPRGDTSLRQNEGEDRDGDGIPDTEDADETKEKKPADKRGGDHGGQGAATTTPRRPMANRQEMPKTDPSAPRDLRSLAAIAMEGGTTRYDLPAPVTIPDKSATMVMLAVRRVPGEAIFLFAPDGGVADSTAHPFRVVRFANRTGGALERGPIAVFEKGAFLGQGMVDPLPEGATATVPFALERAIAIESEKKYDQLGERIAKIENSELTIERDAVTQTKYRIRNGGDAAAKILVRHARQSGTRLFQPPKDTEDNVGTASALVPTSVAARATGELTVDERQTMRMQMDWFSVVADNAVKAFLVDPRADKIVAGKLSGAWSYRDQILALREARGKLAQEQMELGNQTEETRRNLRAIQQNKAADALRAKLTARLGEMATRMDDITKQLVETDSKLAEIGVRFKEAIREIKLVETPSAKP